MRKKAGGGYQRYKQHSSIEITHARRRDNYSEFAEKAVLALELEQPALVSSSLFKTSGGALIANDDIIINGQTRAWTIGNYLTLLKKSPSNVQIGVGYVLSDDHSSDDDLTNDGLTTVSCQKEISFHYNA